MPAFEGQQVNWPSTRVPVTAVKTYELSAPVSTHWRPASCEEVGCEPWRDGWKTIIDENTDLGKRQAEYLRKHAGREMTEVYVGQGVTSFLFPAGQRCFKSSEHRVQVRPALYVVRDGDWRGNPTGRRFTHTRPDHWVEDFAEHQRRLADAQDQG